MRKNQRRWIALAAPLSVLAVVPAALWLSLTRPPDFYRTKVAMPKERRRAEARRFVAQGLQLRNDIANEPSWEATFSDEEVNAWLAEDLVAHFADQIPPGVQEPRVAFESDRVTLAFQLDEGPIRSVVWVVLKVRVRSANTLALTLEKIRAGLVPIPAGRLTERITRQAERHGLQVHWEQEDDLPVAVVRYTPDPRRSDVVLEHLQVLNGEIRLAGRSHRSRGASARLSLPTRRVLQSTFPTRKTQPRVSSFTPVS